MDAGNNTSRVRIPHKGAKVGRQANRFLRKPMANGTAYAARVLHGTISKKLFAHLPSSDLFQIEASIADGAGFVNRFSSSGAAGPGP